jgi:protein-tyrosine phosphatase
MDEIIPNLYISDWISANNKDLLLYKNITHIVNVSQVPNSFPELFIYLKVDIEDDDDENIDKYFTKVSRFINNAILKGGYVLVHCIAGISRTLLVSDETAPLGHPEGMCARRARVVIGYLIQKRKMKLKEAFDLVKLKRKKICPNEGFLEQLHKRFDAETIN